MKKIIALVLTIVILAAAGVACAEEKTNWTLAQVGDTHEIVLNMPTPVHVGFMDDMPEGTVYARATREGCANVYIIITPSDVSDGISMNDLDENGLALFKSLCGAQYLQPIIEEHTTPAGNLYIEVCSNEESDIDSFITLFEGYLIQIDYYHPDFSPLTEADHAFAEEILYNVWINEIK